ncbi:MAG TPA: cytochrome P450 [Myxococcota bacterium]|nr:cytochrome P450 [Myxococcota bacterium]
MSQAVLMPELDFALAPLPDLHAVLERLRSHGPVVPVRFHGERTWLILGYDELTAAFADDETFPSREIYERIAMPVMGKTIQCMAGDEHRRNRALVSHAFRPALMRRAVEALLEPLAHELIDRFAARGEADLVADFARRFPFLAITRLLGIPVADEDKLIDWAQRLIEFPWDPEGARAGAREFTDYLRVLVAERRARPGEDLISELAHAELDGERLGDEEIFSFLRLLFPAGSDTTYKNLGSLLALVLERPAIAALAREDAEAIPAIVDEGLRCEPPVALLPRACGKDVHWAGVHLAAGAPLLYGIAAANRDPRIFPDPHRFDPARKGSRHLTFGHGLHFCLGSHLARRELEVALAAVLQRLPGLALAETAPVRITGGVIRGPERVPARWEASRA